MNRLLLLAAILAASCAKAQDPAAVNNVANEAAPDKTAKDAAAPAPAIQPKPAPLPVVADGVKANRILVDKSERSLILFANGKEIARYGGIRFGDAPTGHKQFEGDEKTPEGDYIINGRNSSSRYHLSLRISYPNAADRAYAKAQGKPPGGDIFIHGQPNGYSGPVLTRDWTDGCIALSNAEIAQIWKLVPDGTKITIQP
ncbi:MAG: L,D-transpeptidase family protein [Sphingomonadales bacterium]|nr:L,D-transpeptidase family protein [Sphingomonadales bacterium]